MSDMLRMDESNVAPLDAMPLDLSQEQTLPETPFTAAPSPFERVRFSTGAILSFDGYEETFDVTILNLSQTGIACTGPRGMVPKDRLRLRFRLQLGHEMESFLCEVVWVQETPEEPQRITPEPNDEAHYGMRFVDLDAALAKRVECVVQERTEGRAIEWTLPVMPTIDGHLGLDGEHDFVLNPNFDTDLRDATDPFVSHTAAAYELHQTDKVAQILEWWQRARRQKNTWIGVSAGLFLGLSVALFAAGHRSGPTLAKSPASAAQHLDFANEPPDAARLPLDLSGETKAVPAASTTSSRVAPPMPVGAIEPPRTTPKVIVQNSTAPVTATKQNKAPAQTHKPASPVTRRVKELAAQTATTSRVEKTRPYIEGGANRATLILTLDKTARMPSTMWMAEPRRLVVDVPGAHAAAQGKTFDLDHPLVSRVRVGQHGDKVRFVAETASAIRSDISTRVVGNTVQIELRRP